MVHEEPVITNRKSHVISHTLGDTFHIDGDTFHKDGDTFHIDGE